VIEIVAKSLGRSDSAQVGASASLVRDLRADALDKIEIILALEDSFNPGRTKLTQHLSVLSRIILCKERGFRDHCADSASW
jgi:hypothetical protein